MSIASPGDKDEMRTREFFDTKTLSRGTTVVVDSTTGAFCCSAHGPWSGA